MSPFGDYSPLPTTLVREEQAACFLVRDANDQALSYGTYQALLRSSSALSMARVGDPNDVRHPSLAYVSRELLFI